ncbi:MAG: ABC transporter ATP-binding protein [Candidatus Thorarchaeota archaeon]
MDELLQNGYDIEIFNLSKDYKLKGKGNKIQALNNINLKIKKGEIFGLLGPNGAGKTTMVSILVTLLQPTSGYAMILGHNLLKEPWYVRENVGVMFGSEMIYHRLTGYKNLKFFCKLYGINNYREKINELTELFNIKNWLKEYVGNYSKGMKLKLALTRVLLIDPKILFLDEPMLGLDPKSVKDVIEILKSLNKTILLTSHQMDIVQRICDKIAFLKQGTIVKVDTKKILKH